MMASSSSSTRWTRFIFLAASCFLLGGCKKQEGVVWNSGDNAPVANAIVYHNGKSLITDSEGKFVIRQVDPKQPVLVKASGFLQKRVDLEGSSELKVGLERFDAKALYMSYYIFISPSLRDRVLAPVENSSVNALVIDVKNDEGKISIPFQHPNATHVANATNASGKEIRSFIDSLRAKKVYLIARVCVFKDKLLAEKRPDLAIIDIKKEKPYSEKDNMSWMDPFQEEVWDYTIAVAKAAAEYGFDEIQFDYVRFPVQTGPGVAQYKKTNTPENRAEAIPGFLKKAYAALAPHNVYVAADVFGLTCFQDEEETIGQQMRRLNEYTDYLCPMVYPSGFTRSDRFTHTPVDIPYEIVLNSMKHGKQRVNNHSKKLRPWLQGFRDYAFDKRDFTQKEIALQILASEETETSGWMLWNAANNYSEVVDAVRLVESGTSLHALKSMVPPSTNLVTPVKVAEDKLDHHL